MQWLPDVSLWLTAKAELKYYGSFIIADYVITILTTTIYQGDTQVLWDSYQKTDTHTHTHKNKKIACRIILVSSEGHSQSASTYLD